MKIYKIVCFFHVICSAFVYIYGRDLFHFQGYFLLLLFSTYILATEVEVGRVVDEKGLLDTTRRESQWPCAPIGFYVNQKQQK
jgi:hypothetical protein